MKIYQQMKQQKTWQILVYNLKKFIQLQKIKMQKKKKEITKDKYTKDKNTQDTLKRKRNNKTKDEV